MYAKYQVKQRSNKPYDYSVFQNEPTDEIDFLAGKYPLEILVYSKLSSVYDDLDPKHTKALYKTVMDMVERPLLQVVLERTGGNQRQAAEMLGINRNTLRKKLEALGLEKEQFKPCPKRKR